MTKHEQVDLRGTLVDKGIASLLELLWDRGWKTTHSCEDNEGQVYISFVNELDALKFMTHMREHLGFKDFYVHAGRYHLNLGLKGACVRFDRYSSGQGSDNGASPPPEGHIHHTQDMLEITTEVMMTHSSHRLSIMT